MNDFLMSFLIYLVPANIIGGTTFLVGRKRAQMEAIEYFAIYAPFLAFALMSLGYLNNPEAMSSNTTLHAFAVIFQPIGSGVLGGLALMPRLFIQSESRKKRLMTTAICAAVMMGIYTISRLLLFTVLGASYS